TYVLRHQVSACPARCFGFLVVVPAFIFHKAVGQLFVPARIPIHCGRRLSPAIVGVRWRRGWASGLRVVWAGGVGAPVFGRTVLRQALSPVLWGRDGVGCLWFWSQGGGSGRIPAHGPGAVSAFWASITGGRRGLVLSGNRVNQLVGAEGLCDRFPQVVRVWPVLGCVLERLGRETQSH